MNKILLTLFFILNCILCTAQSYIESYNLATDKYDNHKEDVRIIRNINGGTVIIPEFDENCPEDLKAPFSYACKILEEYMLPSLPLRIKVSVEKLTGQYSNAISKVLILTKNNFGCYQDVSIPITRIKCVILAELSNNIYATFGQYIPDVEFLTDEYDLQLTYNDYYMSEMSFSLDTNPENKYDFVSIVLRDLLRGLGLCSGFKYNIIEKALENPSRPLTYFENQINIALGSENSGVEKFLNATKGELSVPKKSEQQLQLYAPSTWKNGISLNYFIPQDDCDVSQILSTDFYKGMVYRSLSDDYYNLIFRDLLGWISDTACGSENEYSSQGNTSMIMPYNGSAVLSLDNSSFSTCKTCCNNTNINYQAQKQWIPDTENKNVKTSNISQYLELFHPYYLGGSDSSTTISVLKKDGTWDVVGSSNKSLHKMSDWIFHFDDSEYARTIDGYLRGRITYKFNDNYYNSSYYKSLFFVIDYLPQKVALKCKLMETTTSNTSITSQSLSSITNVRIYFTDTEGVDQIILERLKQGSRIPNKISITDIKKGYYDTSIDKATTFTAVAYNKNGSTRGIPVTIVPLNEESSNQITLDLSDNLIQIKSQNADSHYSYEIQSLGINDISNIYKGTSENVIDISDLPLGNYVIRVMEDKSQTTGILKFRK